MARATRNGTPPPNDTANPCNSDKSETIMAKPNADWTPDRDDPQPSAPKNRDERVQINRGREPAPGSSSDDVETGAQRLSPGIAPTPRTEPADTFAVQESSHPGDVRAGPGDAGSSGSPHRSTEPAKAPDTSGRRMALWIAIALGVLALVAILY
jgi:hypothetical protein